jgi:DNA-binding HxlR family transcriptional regulator
MPRHSPTSTSPTATLSTPLPSARSSRRSPSPTPLRSSCPVACALDLVGDRWTLLVIRDLFAGKHRFGQFLASPEHIPTNILADRLKRLETAGLLAHMAYSQHPPRYEYHLTERGRTLEPLLDAIAVWGLTQYLGTRRPTRTPLVNV